MPRFHLIAVRCLAKQNDGSRSRKWIHVYISRYIWYFSWISTQLYHELAEFWFIKASCLRSIYSLLSVFWKAEGSNLVDLKVGYPWNAWKALRLGESLCGFGPTPSCASPFRSASVSWYLGFGDVGKGKLMGSTWSAKETWRVIPVIPSYLWWQCQGLFTALRRWQDARCNPTTFDLGWGWYRRGSYICHQCSTVCYLEPTLGFMNVSICAFLLWLFCGWWMLMDVDSFRQVFICGAMATHGMCHWEALIRAFRRNSRCCHPRINKTAVEKLWQSTCLSNVDLLIKQPRWSLRIQAVQLQMLGLFSTWINLVRSQARTDSFVHLFFRKKHAVSQGISAAFPTKLTDS